MTMWRICIMVTAGLRTTKTAGQGRQGTNLGQIGLLPNADDVKRGCLDDNDDGIEV
jgi:hypothetical protein